MDQVKAAFSQDLSLVDRIQTVLAKYQDPDLAYLFSDIVAYIQHARLSNEKPTKQETLVVNKKRKLDSSGTENDRLLFECKDVSVAIPVRKKLKIELSSSDRDGTVRLVDGKTGTEEYSLNRADIGHLFQLPIPEKVARQQNFVLLPKEEDVEPIVFAVNESLDKQHTVAKRSGGPIEGETLVDVTSRELRAFGLNVEKPDANEFSSSIAEPHRKGEKAYHVKAFRGSKEGYLYFLASGILFGFKKPLSFFPFNSIQSISYTSVLQRTFNLVITTDTAQEVEFSMLDQADFAGIDAYIKTHNLNDASMAAERQAKKYNVNKVKNEAASGDDADEAEHANGQPDIQRTEQEIQDEEDELEEDYDPSGGESDGEGDESEGEEQQDNEDVGHEDVGSGD